VSRLEDASGVKNPGRVRGALSCFPSPTLLLRCNEVSNSIVLSIGLPPVTPADDLLGGPSAVAGATTDGEESVRDLSLAEFRIGGVGEGVGSAAADRNESGRSLSEAGRWRCGCGDGAGGTY
jgi:hypothetical protein